MTSYELRTFDGRIFNITLAKHAEIEQALEKGKKFVMIDDFTREKVHTSNIAGIYKKRFTEADRITDPGKQLKEGEVKLADKNSPGYIKFRAELKKFRERFGKTR